MVRTRLSMHSHTSQSRNAMFHVLFLTTCCIVANTDYELECRTVHNGELLFLQVPYQEYRIQDMHICPSLVLLVHQRLDTACTLFACFQIHQSTIEHAPMEFASLGGQKPLVVLAGLPIYQIVGPVGSLLEHVSDRPRHDLIDIFSADAEGTMESAFAAVFGSFSFFSHFPCQPQNLYLFLSR